MRKTKVSTRPPRFSGGNATPRRRGNSSPPNSGKGPLTECEEDTCQDETLLLDESISIDLSFTTRPDCFKTVTHYPTKQSVITTFVCLSLLETDRIVSGSLQRYLQFVILNQPRTNGNMPPYYKDLRAALVQQDYIRALQAVESWPSTDDLSQLSVRALLALAVPDSHAALYLTAQANDSVRKQKDASPLQAAQVATDIGMCYFATDRPTQALQLWRQAMHLACLSVGYEHHYVAVLLNNIGVLHHQAEDNVASVRALQESVELQRKMQHPNAMYQLANTLINLAMAYEQRGQQTRASEILQEATNLYDSLSLDTKLIQEHATRIRRCIDQDGRPYLNHSYHGSIDSVMSVESTRSAKVFGNSDGIPSKNTSALYAMEFSDQHDMLTLGSLTEEFLAEDRVRHGVMEWFCQSDLPDPSARPVPIDVDMGQVLNAELVLEEIHGQAIKYLDYGQVQNALDLFEAARLNHVTKFGKFHHLVGNAIHNKGMIYLFDKDYERACQAFEEATKVRAKALGSNHTLVAQSMMKIVFCQVALNEPNEALANLKDIRDIFLKVLGYGHPHMATIYNNLGFVQFMVGSTRRAAKSFQMALEYQRLLIDNNRGADPVIVEISMSRCLSNLAYVSAREGDKAAAMAHYRNAVEILQRYIEHDDPELVCVRSNLQFLLRGIADGAEYDFLPVTGCRQDWFFDFFTCATGDVNN